MKITFLGTGTSQGVPVINCKCEVCTSMDARDKRLRTSIHLQTENKSFIIDTGPDFRQQVLSNGIHALDAVLYTHQHKDHVAGLDDIRGFNFSLNKDIPVYGTEAVIKQLKQEFAYIFAADKYPGVPRVDTQLITNDPFTIKGVKFTPIEVMHHKLPVLGFRHRNFTYITDAKYINDEEKQKLAGTEVLVINALQHQHHISHLTFKEALSLIKEVKPRLAFLTHISHNLGTHQDMTRLLPDHIHLAYDGQQIEI